MSRRTAHSFTLRALPILGTLSAIGLAGTATAQPVSLDPDDPPAVLIPFQAEPELGDHVGRVEGVVDEAGKRFYLDGLDVMSPLVIQVLAKDEAKPIDVSLHRFFWKQPNLEGRTDEEGNWGYVGRIHDEVGIELRADEPTEFYILAWQGLAFEPSYGERVFTSAVGGQGGERSGRTAWVLGLAALLAIGGLVLVSKLRRKGPATAGLIVLALSSTAQVVQANELAVRLARAEQEIGRVWRYSTEVMRVALLARREISDVRQQQELSRDHLWELKGELTGLRHYVEALSLETASDIARLQSAIEALELLAEEDRAAIPDPTHGGVPPMQSSCYADVECGVCFESAHADLVDQLQWHAKLAAIYRSGDAYLTSMVQYGDAQSGWHQLEQAEWYTQKQKITASHERLRTAYRNKLEDYNGRLLSILDQYGACEQEFGLDDWSARYGYPFFEALTASYRIP